MPKDMFELKQSLNEKALNLISKKGVGSQFLMTRRPNEISDYLCPFSLMVSIERSSMPPIQELLAGQVTSMRVYEADSKLYIDFNINLPKIGDDLLCDKIRVSEEMVELIFNPQIARASIYSCSFTLTFHLPIVTYT